MAAAGHEVGLRPVFYICCLLPSAIFFAYLQLICGNPHLWDREEVRMKTLNALFERSAHDRFLWEDWVDGTNELFSTLKAAKGVKEAEFILEEAFNDEYRSPVILTHFRVCKRYP